MSTSKYHAGGRFGPGRFTVIAPVVVKKPFNWKPYAVLAFLVALFAFLFVSGFIARIEVLMRTAVWY
jgi:hypothetical protein